MPAVVAGYHSLVYDFREIAPLRVIQHERKLAGRPVFTAVCADALDVLEPLILSCFQFAHGETSVNRFFCLRPGLNLLVRVGLGAFSGAAHALPNFDAPSILPL
jgi:hypothetical protein